MQATTPWAIAVILGPVVLAVLALWAQSRSRQVDRATDPTHARDDPSLGLTTRPPGAGEPAHYPMTAGPIAVAILASAAIGLCLLFEMPLLRTLFVG
jgi:hypothetical protein